ncbi:hypothetical protein AB1P65_09430 [Roseibium alexandrii]
MSKEIVVKIIDARPWSYWIKNASGYVCLAAMIGLGVFLDSPAMQWIAAIIFFMACVGKVMGMKKYTLPEARKYLEELEAGK